VISRTRFVLLSSRTVQVRRRIADGIRGSSFVVGFEKTSRRKAPCTKCHNKRRAFRIDPSLPGFSALPSGRPPLSVFLFLPLFLANFGHPNSNPKSLKVLLSSNAALLGTLQSSLSSHAKNLLLRHLQPLFRPTCHARRGLVEAPRGLVRDCGMAGHDMTPESPHLNASQIHAAAIIQNIVRLLVTLQYQSEAT
jgi:hypothetical protein